jgi:beta-lactamase class A
MNIQYDFSRTHSHIEKRRSLVVSLTAFMLTSIIPGKGAAFASNDPAQKLQDLEDKARGRLGAYIFDTKTQKGIGWRENSRFAHCSSFKMSLAAMVLYKSDIGKANLNEVLHWNTSDMLPVSPVTKENISKGLSIEELARATLVTSDNTAANVLLKRFGGPNELTLFWQKIGDKTSRLDRYEPDLNTTPPGTILDTTTPKAMAMTTATLVHGDLLTLKSKTKLKQWMTDVRTGSQRLRAGFPADWVSGDKTGTGIGNTKHTYVDIAFGGPAGRSPLVVTAYFEPDNLVEPMDPISIKVLADVGLVAASTII